MWKEAPNHRISIGYNLRCELRSVAADTAAADDTPVIEVDEVRETEEEDKFLTAARIYTPEKDDASELFDDDFIALHRPCAVSSHSRSQKAPAVVSPGGATPARAQRQRTHVGRQGPLVLLEPTLGR